MDFSKPGKEDYSNPGKIFYLREPEVTFSDKIVNAQPFSKYTEG